MSKDWDPTSVFDVFGDELVREILVLASRRPVSAGELADCADVSRSTVYRRLDTLTELDLLTEQLRVGDDGTQYREYETTLKRVTFEITDGGFEADIRIRRDVADRFEAFWEELEESSRTDLAAGERGEPGGEPERG